ncbi:MAG: biotin--[acetyl-CoA-carboxylase] ligase [Nitrososphaerota archaeon]|nr:biotin--[acetyl-CoA-carboxylase] ligase [Nitrososphaerota archaeon]
MVKWSFIELDEVGSTQEVAKGLAAEGAPEGTTVVAKSQTSGMGRLGRRWLSPEGGLYMSFVLKPDRIKRPELATIVSTAAVAEGIEKSTGLAPTIRWPNDVMLRGKKLAGVIAEAQASSGGVSSIVVGIGVDCRRSADLQSLRGESTTVEQELGRPIAIPEVMRSILGSFSVLYGRWAAGDDVRKEWARRVGTLGKHVLVKLKTEENPFSCTAKTLEDDGSLSVSLAGKDRVVRAEDLEWLREQG